MKNVNILSLFIILSICLIPLSSIEAALVPTLKTTHQVKKTIKKKARKGLKNHKKRLKKHPQRARKKHFKPEQQNEYEGIWAILIAILSIYLITAILLTVFGFIYMIPGLWVTGVILLLIPIILIIYSIIKSSIQNKKSKKEVAAREAAKKKITK